MRRADTFLLTGLALCLLIGSCVAALFGTACAVHTEVVNPS